jgi:hypothetical protein
MAMKPKRYSAGLAFQNLKAAVQFSGVTRLGLVLVAFGLPVSGEWLAAALLPRGAVKKGRIRALPRSGSHLWLPYRPASLCAVGSAPEASRGAEREASL